MRNHCLKKDIIYIDLDKMQIDKNENGNDKYYTCLCNKNNDVLYNMVIDLARC